MPRVSNTFRITTGLVALSFSVLMAAMAIGLIPDRNQLQVESRTALCEAIAVNSSVFASQGNIRQLESSLRGIVDHNPDLLSAAVRRNDGRLLLEIGDHVSIWTLAANDPSSESEIRVPIWSGSQPWGSIELRFHRLSPKGYLQWLSSPLVRLGIFLICTTFLVFFFYLCRTLNPMDASVVPGRVRAALNTLAEGLLLLDNDGRIVLANDAFARTLERDPADLIGKRASDLSWLGENNQNPLNYPWAQSIQERVQRSDVTLSLRVGSDEPRIFKVNSTPILAENGTCRGALATFIDVTTIERNRLELRGMLEALRNSREEISRQNQELQILATRDPLTSCLNRRSFFEQFEMQWKQSERLRLPLSCLMVDIDHFKRINDTHGHSMGDTVLQRVAATLRTGVREQDIVCRYGGEEFAVLMPDTAVEVGAALAETLRQKIAGLEFPQLSITASFGIAVRTAETVDEHTLLNRADECLYVAKRTGRNQVIRADLVSREQLQQHEPATKSSAPEETVSAFIPFHAVTALLSALSYRDTATAEHSRRVADLCVMTAAGLMPSIDVYVLEVAALMHDIGKIGVPDAILLKPGPLTEEEWKIMGQHDRFGVEILHSTFSSPRLTGIVLNHHAWFGGNPRHHDLPMGLSIPVGARILSIADAYDAMVSDRVYRRGRSPEEAFAELRRCAGRQFDPELVERFIQVISDRHRSTGPELGRVSKQTALQIGLEIERLASTLDSQDLFGLKSLAGRLKATATKSGILEIADLTARIEDAAHENADLKEIFQLTSELLDLCRSTQRAFLESSSDEELHEPCHSRA